MKTNRYIAFVLVILLVTVGAFSQDYARLSERSIMGTARYVGMGGAMTAIGGDPSSVLDNPAGLGLYQRAEMLVTFDETLDYTRQVGASKKQFRSLFMCPHVSVVFSVPTFSSNPNGVQSYNFMLSYHRRQTYHRNYDAVGAGGVSLGAIMPDLDIPFNRGLNTGHDLLLKEWGHVNEYSFDWAMNIGHQWYVGLGFNVQDYLLTSDGVYTEYFDTLSIEGNVYDNQNATSLRLSGVSCNFSAGVIYRPWKWLRLGFGIQTPSLGTLRTYTYGTFSSQTDSLRFSYAPDLSFKDNSFHMPLHLSSSMAFQFGAYGMLSLQYDYTHLQLQKPIHSLRVGLEVIPVMGMYVNAGYVYESSFRKNVPIGIDTSFDRQDAYSVFSRSSQYASIAMGYRGQNFVAQVAYQYRWQKMDVFAHVNADPYDIHTDTHRIVLTIGWRHN